MNILKNIRDFKIHYLIITATFLIEGCSPSAIVINPVKDQPLPEYRKNFSSDISDSGGVYLSGGGYRATLFHLGVLWRLNELGVLNEIKHFSVVSGGAIVGAQLVLQWGNLDFDKAGVAQSFYPIVVRPILEITSRTIDWPSVLIGALTPSTSSSQLNKKYDDILFKGARLTDFPGKSQGPEININATALQTGEPWRFSRDIMGGQTFFSMLPTGDTKISVAVAASSGYPPLLSPTVIDIRKLPQRPIKKASERNKNKNAHFDGELMTHRDRERKKANELLHAVQLADGGILNNIGSSDNNFKFMKSIFISDARVYNKIDEDLKTDWMSNGLRAIDLAIDAKENSIRRQTHATFDVTKDQFERPDRMLFYLPLNEIANMTRAFAARKKCIETLERLIKTADADDALWAQKTLNLWKSISQEYDNLITDHFVSMDKASIDTKLEKLTLETQIHLINWGYVVAETQILNTLLMKGFFTRWKNSPKLLYQSIAGFIPNFWTAPLKLPGKKIEKEVND